MVKFFSYNPLNLNIKARKLVYSMLEINPEKRISLTNILTHKFVIKHYLDEENKHKEESRSHISITTDKSKMFHHKNDKSSEEKKNSPKFWKKSLTQQNDIISFNDNEGVPNRMSNNMSPKFKKQAQQVKSAKFSDGKSNLKPPRNDLQKFSKNKMVPGLLMNNQSNLLEVLENHEQLKSVD